MLVSISILLSFFTLSFTFTYFLLHGSRSNRHVDSQMDRHVDRQTDGQACRESDETDTEVQADADRHRQTQTDTDRHRQAQTDTDRQKERS